MNRRCFVRAVGGIGLAAPLVGCRLPLHPVSGAPLPPVARIQKGISFTGWDRGDYSSAAADQSIRRLAVTGAQWIALVPQGYQDTIRSTAIDWQSPKTASDEDLIHAITTAHALGLRVMLKPPVGLTRDSYHWRGDIGPAFPAEVAWQSWFASYDEAIVHYDRFAQVQQVEQLCVGTELPGVSGREESWRGLVRKVRNQYTGSVVYASNWGEEQNVRWWDAVDFIGVDAYYALSDAVTPTVVELKQAWVEQEYVGLLQSLATKYGKRVLFTEIGYPNVDRAAWEPWNFAAPGAANPQAQANAYQAAIETFTDQSWFAGFFWWEWPTNLLQSGPDATDYVLAGKPAEQIVTRAYSQR
jgi:hypothetical protein